MSKIPELPEEEWPEIRRLKASSNTGWTYFANLMKTMHRLMGEEKACEILAESQAENAKRFLLPAMKSFGVEGNDPRAAASYFKLADGDILGANVEWIEESPQKVILRFHPPCALFPDLSEAHATPKMCLALGNFEYTAAKLLNVKITFTKMITAGDPYCDVVFEPAESG